MPSDAHARRELRPTRALLFDFDGVIVHTEPLHREALLEALAPLGLSFSEDEYYARYVAFSDRDLIPRIFADHARVLAHEELRALLARKWEAFDRLIEAKGPQPIPATIAIIKEAHAQGVPIAVCSAATRRDITAVLARVGVLDCFRVIVSVDDVPVSKPDPAPYRLAAKLVGFAAAECVAIEDTPGGLRSALDAGCLTVGVGHTVSPERLTDAHLVVRSSKELTLDTLLTLEA